MSLYETKQKTEFPEHFEFEETALKSWTQGFGDVSLCCELVFSHVFQSLTHCMLSVCVCVYTRVCSATSVISDSSHHGL